MFRVLSSFCVGIYVGYKWHTNIETYWNDFKHTNIYKELEDKCKKNE